MNVITNIGSVVQRGFSSLLLLLALCMVLASCDTAQTRQRMADIIAEADSMNRHYVPMTSDSLLLLACRYYDRHGSPNERMRAHYLLGCTYRDMGEAPQAIESYQLAINSADTTATDCDFHTLGCIYSQMADVYYHQLLFSNDIESRREAIRFAKIANDTLAMLFDMKVSAATYILMNKKDSAEIILREVLRFGQEGGYRKECLQTSLILMHVVAEHPSRHAELNQLIKDYEEGISLMNLPPKHMFYYYKGRYFEWQNMLDSAEFYYRKMYHPQMPYTAQCSMAKGLLRLYQKRQIPDSVSKYAQFYCDVNDSSIAVNDQKQTARLAASYRYSTIQRKALEHEQEANHTRTTLIVFIALTLLASIVLLYTWLRYKEKKQDEVEKLKAKYADSLDVYHHNLQTLRIIDDTRKATIEEMRQKLTSMEEELRNENNQLKVTIEELRQQTNMRQNIEQAQKYADTPIIQRVLALRKTPQVMLTDAEKEDLIRTTSEYYPLLVKHLKQKKDLKGQAVYVCILVGMNLHSGEIANMLGLSFQQVSNLKKEIGRILFDDSSARSLYKNLVRRYEMYTD